MATTEQAGNNPKGIGGFGDNPQNINPGGRPKNSLKSYVARKLAAMRDEEKEEFLKGISKGEVWKMAEGNPSNDNTHKVEGEITITFDQSFQSKNETAPSAEKDS